MRLHSAEDVGKLVAANLCLRFAIDAQRAGGYDVDTHAHSSLITLEYLLRRDALYISNDRLALRQDSYADLAEAVDIQCADAIALTKQEMTLANTDKPLHCYQSIQVHPATKEIFRRYLMGSCFAHN